MTQKIAPDPGSTLTELQFLEMVASTQPALAVFDCDGTLWGGDAGVGFMRWSMESGLLSRDASDRMDLRYRAYLHGEVSELAICGEMVQIYRGLREAEMERAAHTFFENAVRPQIFPEMSELCRRLEANGVTVWAVSSTNDWIVEEAARNFGIPPERVLAARVRVADGLVTDELLDVPTDDGKVVSLAANGINRPDCVFGNSIHDAAMLAIARHPFAVNPTLELNELATKRGWRIYRPKQPHV